MDYSPSRCDNRLLGLPREVIELTFRYLIPSYDLELKRRSLGRDQTKSARSPFIFVRTGSRPENELFRICRMLTSIARSVYRRSFSGRLQIMECFPETSAPFTKFQHDAKLASFWSKIQVLAISRDVLFCEVIENIAATLPGLKAVVIERNEEYTNSFLEGLLPECRENYRWATLLASHVLTRKISDDSRYQNALDKLNDAGRGDVRLCSYHEFKINVDPPQICVSLCF